tara:strand:+ start:27 stop:629 length:603 start_codon:yes stop_codon:yes gene_type:complete
MIKLWQRFKEWLIVRQSAKFAKELKKKGYKPREPWDVGIWLLLLFIGCDDRIKEPNEANVIVTMLRVDRIEILDNLWITPATIWGHLESEDTPVDRLVVHWWSNMYWDENDSSGHYRLLPNRRNKAIWYDNFGNRDTVDVNIDTLRWTTDEYSTVDSLGYFYNTLTPTKVMQNKGSGSYMKLYWNIEGTVVDSQEIFLMD